jgi:hypothetical protein
MGGQAMQLNRRGMKYSELGDEKQHPFRPIIIERDATEFIKTSEGIVVFVKAKRKGKNNSYDYHLYLKSSEILEILQKLLKTEEQQKKAE